MNIKAFILIVSLITGFTVWCLGCIGPKNQQSVEKSVYSAAIDTAQKTMAAAQNKNSREFVKLAFDYRQNRNGYYECYKLLQNVRPDANAKWQVKRDTNNGCINVSCKLDKNRKLLIVLQTLPDNSMKFAYACTLNA